MDCAVSLMFNLCVEARDGLNLWLLSSISSKQQAEQQFVVTDDAQQLEGGFPSFHGCTSSVFSFYENNLTWSTAVGLVNSGRLAATRTVLMEMIPTFVWFWVLTQHCFCQRFWADVRGWWLEVRENYLEKKGREQEMGWFGTVVEFWEQIFWSCWECVLASCLPSCLIWFTCKCFSYNLMAIVQEPANCQNMLDWIKKCGKWLSICLLSVLSWDGVWATDGFQFPWNVCSALCGTE